MNIIMTRHPKRMRPPTVTLDQPPSQVAKRTIDPKEIVVAYAEALKAKKTPDLSALEIIDAMRQVLDNPTKGKNTHMPLPFKVIVALIHIGEYTPNPKIGQVASQTIIATYELAAAIHKDEDPVDYEKVIRVPPYQRVIMYALGLVLGEDSGAPHPTTEDMKDSEVKFLETTSLEGQAQHDQLRASADEINRMLLYSLTIIGRFDSGESVKSLATAKVSSAITIGVVKPPKEYSLDPIGFSSDAIAADYLSMWGGGVAQEGDGQSDLRSLAKAIEVLTYSIAELKGVIKDFSFSPNETIRKAAEKKLAEMNERIEGADTESDFESDKPRKKWTN